MRKTLDIGIPGMLLIAAALLLPSPAMAQHGWPVEPANSDHPMGNSFGEFLEVAGAAFLHSGIDLMELPMYDSSDNINPNAPWVIVTVPGIPKATGLTDQTSTTSGPDGFRRYVAVVKSTSAEGTVWYRYWHLQGGSYDPDYKLACKNGTTVAAEQRIARIVDWNTDPGEDPPDPPCDFHHLHYELDDGTDYLNPLADITPNPDADPPHIEEIHFAQDNSDPWAPFNPVAGNACTVVSGSVDILVEGGDRDEAGAPLGAFGHLWVYNVRWRVCPDTDPDCPWQETRPFDTIPYGWYILGNSTTTEQFSTRLPWVSNASSCDAGWDNAIVTNYDNGRPDVAGGWKTTDLADGSYSVSVELTDFTWNTTVMTRRACVQNNSACTAELVIRDGTDDYGAIPYPGPKWWLSPDITANPGTPDEDRNIRLGVANPIEVRIWNYGSCDLPAGTTYDLCLGWGPPSGSLPASQQIYCQTETVPADGWVVGTSHTTTFTWTPDPAMIPEGHHCLIAWVDFPLDDPLQNTPAVNWDDNRAQQNITFAPAPTAGSPFLSRSWVHSQDLIKARSIELKPRYSRNRPTLRKVRLHVPPGLIVDQIVGGSVIGDYRGDKPIEPCELPPEELRRTMCQSWEESSELGYTRIIGGIDPSGRLLLKNVRVLGESVGLTLGVWSEDDVPKGEFADIEVAEYGLLVGHSQITPVGGLTVRFEH